MTGRRAWGDIPSKRNGRVRLPFEVVHPEGCARSGILNVRVESSAEPGHGRFDILFAHGAELRVGFLDEARLNLLRSLVRDLEKGVGHAVLLLIEVNFERAVPARASPFRVKGLKLVYKAVKKVVDRVSDQGGFDFIHGRESRLDGHAGHTALCTDFGFDESYRVRDHLVPAVLGRQ